MIEFNNDPRTSLIGQYGVWANSLLPDLPLLSYRKDEFKRIKTWHKLAKAKTMECLAAPEIAGMPKVNIHKRYHYDGLEVEELSWQLPYGRPTKAVVLKPKGARGRLPAMLGLHDHSGNKYLGHRKIVRTQDNLPPFVKALQVNAYGDRAWANELAKRGYVVLVHDAFTFGSRRVRYQDVAGFTWGPLVIKDQTDEDPEHPDHVAAYNDWASEHEHVMAKSLLSAGTTWPGVFLSEDRLALNVLCARSDVDTKRIACAGLSGGGLRTAYLGGLDHRIKAAVCVGFMTTWKDFILHKSHTHTWMTYIPILSKYLDFPEIYGLRVPLPTMVLNNKQDDLYTLEEMQAADDILQKVFAKAGASDQYSCKYYEGDHKFDKQMQEDAFAWLDRWMGH